MKKVKITVMKTACYTDLIEAYENLILHACDMHEDKFLLQTAGNGRRIFVKAPGKAYPLSSWRLPTAAKTFMTAG